MTKTENRTEPNNGFETVIEITVPAVPVLTLSEIDRLIRPAVSGPIYVIGRISDGYNPTGKPKSKSVRIIYRYRYPVRLIEIDRITDIVSKISTDVSISTGRTYGTGFDPLSVDSVFETADGIRSDDITGRPDNGITERTVNNDIGSSDGLSESDVYDDRNETDDDE